MNLLEPLLNPIMNQLHLLRCHPLNLHLILIKELGRFLQINSNRILPLRHRDYILHLNVPVHLLLLKTQIDNVDIYDNQSFQTFFFRVLDHEHVDEFAVSEFGFSDELKNIHYFSVNDVVLFEERVLAVERSRASHTAFVGLVFEKHHGVFEAFGCFGGEVEDTCDGFDDSSSETLVCSFEESEESIFGCVLVRFEEDTCDSLFES